MREWTEDKLNGAIRAALQTDFTKKGTTGKIEGEIKF